MKILSWNVRGLGKPSKRHLVKEIISSSRSDIICLQETKLQDVHKSTWRTIGGVRLNSFDFLPAQGSAGGIIVAWDRAQALGTLFHKETFSISIKFMNTSNNFTWICTCVYGPVTRSLKVEFWNELRNIRNLHALPWVICGDFNTTFSLDDKNTGDLNSKDISTSQSFLDDLNLIDPPLHGRSYTWSNGQSVPIWIRLDRFLYSHDWILSNPRTLQSALPRFGSDHSPICLDFGNHIPRHRIFRLEKSWYSNDQLETLIQGWWSELNLDGCGAFIFSKKLPYLKSKLRSWAKITFGNSNALKNSLLLELNSLDSTNESRPLSDDEITGASLLRSDLFALLKQEEIYWKQRSRITWLKEGDSNMKYFHSLANGRRNSNFIPHINHNGQWVEGNQEIGKIFRDHFHTLFGTPITNRFLLDWSFLFEHKTRVDLSSLELPFTTEEIKLAVFGLNADKATGPDGFPLFFFQKHWDLL
ncbi:RNA-directed DNA polymerase protein [Dioscorea alata]|uniref:RNA-directed DNA polymerase protein n=1 Tax=Dioscorea alata TaxID=55571 RepID=A0ACB7UZT7_DIOAL|nr:RNA-directed DNA polymerase protein [Dioscorea alata]